MLTYNFVYDFVTPHAQTIIDIMIREWGYNYIDGFGYTNTSEYKLWKNDTVFLVAENESNEFVGMVAFERYNIARNARFTPCICCLYVEQSYRNQSIGEALMTKMTEYTRDSGHSEIFAWTLDSSMSRWFESRNWRYETEYVYLGRRIYVLRCNLID